MPWAYDAFGLPAEQYAVQTGQHPRKTTEDNIVIMRRQLRRLGLGFDDRRSYATIDEDYYRWTQWIFTQIRESWYDPQAVRPTAPWGGAADQRAGRRLGRRDSGRCPSRPGGPGRSCRP
jgi:leucyl-tRNA synthetase